MTLACTLCGSPAVLAVRPGSEDVVAAGIVLRRGEPDRAWCSACWPALTPTPAAPPRTVAREPGRRPAGRAVVPPTRPAGIGEAVA